MRRSLVALIVSAVGMSGAWAEDALSEARSGSHFDVAGIPLADADLARAEGGWTCITVPYNRRGDFEVEQMQDCYRMKFTVSGTTYAADPDNHAKPGTKVAPMAPGCYRMDTTTSGPAVKGFNIKYPDANDYFVHATSSSYTFGCAGVRSGWDSVRTCVGNENYQAQIRVRDR